MSAEIANGMLPRFKLYSKDLWKSSNLFCAVKYWCESFVDLLSCDSSDDDELLKPMLEYEYINDSPWICRDRQMLTADVA